jgi:hypothetical protein
MTALTQAIRVVALPIQISNSIVRGHSFAISPRIFARVLL